MHTAFIQLLNMSYTASWMAVAVILLRLVLKKAPKSLFCAMWALVGVRLVCPFSIESTLSLIPNPKPIPPEILQSTVPQVQTGVPLLNQTINPILQEVFTPQAVATATPLQRVADAAAVVWVVGVLLMVLYTGISAVRLRLRLREAVWLRENIWVCEAIQTPFVFGVFRPRIYLPAALQEADAVYVLAHENAHITRRDHWWKPIGFALLTVYWFNPVMWAAYMLLCRDIELACDEKVIRNLGTDCKKPYSAALINCSVPRKMVMACPLAFGEVDVKGRIKNVLHYKKPTFWLIVLALLVCTAAIVAFLTNPSNKEPIGGGEVSSGTVSSVPDSSSAATSSSAPTSSVLPITALQLNITELVFDDGRFSFSFTQTAEGAPKYRVINGTHLQASSDGIAWKTCGAWTQIDLNEDTLDTRLHSELWWNEAVSVQTLKENTVCAWQIYTEEHNIKTLYLLLKQKDGTYYIGYGYYDFNGCTNADRSMIRWLYHATAETVVLEQSEISPMVYSSAASFVGWSADNRIYTQAINSGMMSISSVRHLPLYKAENVQELARFKETFRTSFQLDYSREGFPSYNEATAQCDEAFFDKYTLFTVYVGSGSSSRRFAIQQANCVDTRFNINIAEIRNGEVENTEMAGWFITVAVPKEALSGCTFFDAALASEATLKINTKNSAQTNG